MRCCPRPATAHSRHTKANLRSLAAHVAPQRLNESRRGFLKAGGALVITFALRPCSAATAAIATPAKTVATDEVDGFLAIDAPGRVTVYSGKVDLGTGLETAMSQIAAEELSVPLDRVTVIQGDTALTPDQGITWGSLSIQNGGMQIPAIGKALGCRGARRGGRAGGHRQGDLRRDRGTASLGALYAGQGVGRARLAGFAPAHRPPREVDWESHGDD